MKKEENSTLLYYDYYYIIYKFKKQIVMNHTKQNINHFQKKTKTLIFNLER